MKLFIDTANISEIRDMAWLVDGVTTNPSLVAKESRPFRDIIAEICELVDGPVSAEVIGLKTDEMVAEGKELASIHDNIVIKIPMTESGMKAVQILTNEGIRTNVTLVFSANQAMMAAKCGATFVSPFVGRLDDIGADGMGLIAEIRECYENYVFPTEILVASVRHPRHLLDSALMGADIATVPYDVLKKAFNHPLTDLGIQRFLKDWEGVPR
ncbi:fructose-6-phosphate aldolase [Candidatus Bipolaricaulota bacterium]|nr:fructose-6-phosphate aldolase [Candidatus Bipolaricaulota bacterium]